MGRKKSDFPTDRQKQIIRLTSLGCTTKEIAAILGIKPSTVDNHRTRVMRELEINCTANLTRYAIRRRISPLTDYLSAEEEEKRRSLRVISGICLNINAIGSDFHPKYPPVDQCDDRHNSD